MQLATEPTAPVTLAVTSQDPGEGTVAPANLTFDATTWNTAQTVTGEDDDVDDGNVAYAIHLDPAGEATNAYTALATHTSTMVTTVDDDTAGLGVDTDGAQTTLTLYEDPQHTANAAAYPVRLTAQPGGEVTLSVTVTGDTAAVGVAPANLTFTATTWNTAQSVTATARNDTDRVNDAATLSHAVSGSGDTDAYPLTLLSPPDAAVAVAVASRDADEGVAAPTNLTFSGTTWNTAQTVTVSAAADDDGRNDAAQLTHRVTSSGADYDDLQTRQPARVPAVAVTVTDADAGDVGVTVDTDLVMTGAQATTLSVTEDGRTTATYTVVLGTEPNGPVTVADDAARR